MMIQPCVPSFCAPPGRQSVERTTLRIEIHSTPLHSTALNKKPIIPSRHLSPFTTLSLTSIHMYKNPTIPYARNTMWSCLASPSSLHAASVSGTAWEARSGVWPRPPVPYPGKKRQSTNTQGTQTQSTTLPGQCTYTGYSALSALGKGGVIGSLADGFFFDLF